MDPLGQMETGNSTSELGDLRQRFCTEIKATGDEGTQSFCLLRTRVAHSHVGIIPGPGPDTSTFFLVRLGSTPLFLLGRGWDQFWGEPSIAWELLLPQMVSWRGLNQWISAMGTLGNVCEHFWLTVGGWVSIWCAEPENATTHGTGRPPTGGPHGFPHPHVTVSSLAEQAWIERWRRCWYSWRHK